MTRVVVKAVPAGGFWEAGKFWPAADTQADVTDEELALLKATPHLCVVEVGKAAPPLPEPVSSHEVTDGKVRRKRGG